VFSDIYSAEKQLMKALAKPARAASDPTLSEALKTHLEETQGQVERIGQLGGVPRHPPEKNEVRCDGRADRGRTVTDRRD
jgi:ferritin-like metal-binding protein YciE